MPSTFRQLGEEERLRGRVVTFVEGQFESPDGERFTRDVVRHPGAVCVVPLTDDGEVVLVRQYRSALDSLVLEIPAGKRDITGEPPDVTARRELAEEIGMEAAHLTPLARFHNSPGFCDEEVHIFLGTGLSEAEAAPEGPEERHMTVERLALREVPSAIAAGTLTDAKTIIGCLLALRAVER